MRSQSLNKIIQTLYEIALHSNSPTGNISAISLQSFGILTKKNQRNTSKIEGTKTRIKRQNPVASKFTEAASMPQIKVFRMFLEQLRNLWAATPIGGKGPFDKNAPEPIVKIFKSRIKDYLFPEVG